MILLIYKLVEGFKMDSDEKILSFKVYDINGQVVTQDYSNNMNTTKEQTQFAAAVFVYEDDGWYGKKYRYFIDGFDSKSDAKRHSVE